MSLFVFDIDGTIVDRSLLVNSETINAINALLNKGNVVAFASGRSFKGAMKFMKLLGDGKKYLITSNGAVVSDFFNKEISHHYLKMEDFIDIYKRYSSIKDFCIMLYQNDKIGYVSNKRYVDVEMKSNDMESFKINIDTVDKNENIEKVMIESHLIESEDLNIPSEYYQKYNIVKSSRHFIEFTHPGADKAHGVETLRKELNIPKEDVYTFGDSLNDYLMIKNYNGICMENGFEECKAVAKYITKSVNENGVVYALKHILKVI